MKSKRGVTDPVTLALVALIALGAGVFGTTWKPLQFLKPKPPTEELTKLQGQLEAAQEAAAKAEKEKEAAVASERTKLEQEIRVAQSDNLGTVTALGKVLPPHRTAEVKLASSMARRVTLKLAAAIGELPKDQQQAMVALIEQALSDKQAEVDEAMRKLAQRDAEFAILAKERDAVAAKIPGLVAEVEKAKESVAKTEAKVTEKTNVIKEIAAKFDAKERERGSLGAALNRVIFWICTVAGLWVFLAFILPAIVKVMDTGPLKNFLRDVSGVVLNPVLHWDAKKKLRDLQKQTNPPFRP
ncbi:MAG: hypothetical protein WC655_24485 [Candidatus Hydrogenedentales bacterium]|jgi:hypothetical protein